MKQSDFNFLSLAKLPTEFQNVHVVYAERDFEYRVRGKVIGSGTILRAINSGNVEAYYTRAGETEKGIFVNFSVDALSYDPASDTGFVFGPPVHDYSELPKPAK